MITENVCQNEAQKKIMETIAEKKEQMMNAGAACKTCENKVDGLQKVVDELKLRIEEMGNQNELLESKVNLWKAKFDKCKAKKNWG